MKRALVVAGQPLRLAGVLNLLYVMGYDSIGALSIAEAERFFAEHEPDLVILLRGGDNDFQSVLKTNFVKLRPLLLVVEHEGGVQILKEKIKRLGS